MTRGHEGPVTLGQAIRAHAHAADETPQADRRVVQCNTVRPTSASSAGARCYLICHAGNGDKVEVLVRTRSGRWADVWKHVRDLRDFRVKTLPPAHPLYRDPRLCDCDPEAAAARLNACKDLYGQHRDQAAACDPSELPTGVS